MILNVKNVIGDIGHQIWEIVKNVNKIGVVIVRPTQVFVLHVVIVITIFSQLMVYVVFVMIMIVLVALLILSVTIVSMVWD